MVLLNGRELLIYKPQLFADDEEAMDDKELEVMPEEEYDAMQNEEFLKEEAAMEAAAAENLGTDGVEDTGDVIAAATAAAEAAAAAAVTTEDVEKAMKGVSIEDEEAAEHAAIKETVGDASLFMDDDDDDDDDDDQDVAAAAEP